MVLITIKHYFFLLFFVIIIQKKNSFEWDGIHLKERHKSLYNIIMNKNVFLADNWLVSDIAEYWQINFTTLRGTGKQDDEKYL